MTYPMKDSRDDNKPLMFLFVAVYSDNMPWATRKPSWIASGPVPFRDRGRVILLGRLSTSHKTGDFRAPVYFPEVVMIHAQFVRMA